MTKTSSLNWNLSDLYAGTKDPAIQADFAKTDELIGTLQSYRGKLATLKPEELLTLIKTWEDAGYLMHKLGLYAGLLESTHVGVDEITRFNKKIEEDLVARGNEMIFIYTEFAQLTEEQWQKILNEPKLAEYAKLLHNLYEDSKHMLSEAEEKIFAEKSQTSWGALSHIYSVTTNTLMFDLDGKKITLEELLILFKNEDPTKRKKAAMLLHEGLKANDKTTPAIYNALVQDKAIHNRLHHYTYPEQARYLSDDVEKEVVEALITAVSNSYAMVQRYYKIKKQLLKTDTLYWWDRYAPLPQTETKVPLDQAQTMVIEAFEGFSPELAKIAQNMFDQKHVDWLPDQAKRGGAFCAFGGRDIYPYVLLNYTETLDDVGVVAHELGHAVHDVLAQENNVYYQTHPSLALAEIASTFGESLLFDKLFGSDIPKNDKIALLMSSIEGSIATIFRQITMFQFEQKVHTLRKQEGELAKDQLDTLWHETMKAPYGDELVYTDEHKNTWMYIPHIINSPFYVYSYAFAQLCTMAIYNAYKTQGQAFVPTYLDILKAGGSLSPKDNLARAGFDITKPAFWQSGLKLLEDDITALEKLA